MWTKLSARVTVRLLACLALAGAPLTPLAAQDRTIGWPSVTVDAVLDANGQLHVRERQVVRFTGDWNGGQRRFDVRAYQWVTLDSLLRLDTASGAWIHLQSGSTAAVDGYEWRNQRVRWRSRRESDPPFAATRLTYALHYTYGGMLQPGDSAVVLNHDFGFADREAAIDTFRVHLVVDPAWATPPGFTGDYVRTAVAPGEGFVVRVPLRWTRGGRAPGIYYGASRTERLAIAVFLLAGLLVVVGLLLQHETAIGRFAPLVPLADINPAWIEANVLVHLPEVVGAAWDDETGAPEVAATLARLVAEGKLASKVVTEKLLVFKWSVLHLRLEVERDTLREHERALVDALFRHDETETDTQKVRERYRKTGFDPAARIRDDLRRRVERLAPRGAPTPTWPHWVTAALVVLGVACLVTGITRHVNDLIVLFFVPFVGIPVTIITLLNATRWRATIVRPLPWMSRFLILVGIVAAFLLAALTDRLGVPMPRMEALTWTGLALLILALTHAACLQARGTQSPERMALRKRLASAREWFRAELRREKPALQDAWYPYLIALGLGPDVDKWFKAFAGVATSGTMSAASWSSGRSSGISGADGASSGGSGWTGFGGGGGFAGGGAGATFASAVGGMASTMSAPSSSSSGGSSSGGGSSGGGGGGGW
ncbi:MAG: DUF2207 domain-containing protein [Gemmatimonadetes bacterium]|nr:DUF2207 domain-containing protein [Gemmatimonadota bacterium]